MLCYLYSQSILRHSSLLFALWRYGGWTAQALSAMIHPESDFFKPIDRLDVLDVVTELEKFSLSSKIQRSQVAEIASQSHGPWLLHLDTRERIIVLQTLAVTYAALGYARKEAYILREVLGSLLDLVVCGREESSARTPSIGLGIRGPSPLNGSTSQGTVGIRENESTDGNESVLRIVKHICKVHGIDLEAVKLLSPDAVAARHSRGDRLDGEESVDELTGWEDASLEPLQDPFGWPELQIGIVREAIAVAEALPSN